MSDPAHSDRNEFWDLSITTGGRYFAKCPEYNSRQNNGVCVNVFSRDPNDWAQLTMTCRLYDFTTANHPITGNDLMAVMLHLSQHTGLITLGGLHCVQNGAVSSGHSSRTGSIRRRMAALTLLSRSKWPWTRADNTCQVIRITLQLGCWGCNRSSGYGKF